MTKPAAPAEIVALAGLLPEGFDWWFVKVLDKYPAKPYVLFSDPYADEAPLDPDLQKTLDTFSGSLFTTIVDSSPGNVADSRQKVRSALGGSLLSTELDLGDSSLRVKRSGVSSPIVEDENEEPDESGRRPFFAVDEYDLVRTNR